MTRSAHSNFTSVNSCRLAKVARLVFKVEQQGTKKTRSKRLFRSRISEDVSKSAYEQRAHQAEPILDSAV